MNEFDFFSKEWTEQNEKLTFVNKKVDDYKEEIKQIFDGTYIVPISTGIPEMDAHYNMFLGMLMLISGFPGAGKSEFARFLACVHVSFNRGKACVFSPESDTPILMIEVITTISKLKGVEWKEAETIVNENFKFQEINENSGMPDIKHLIENAEMLVKDGYNFFVIDPMNWVTSSMYSTGSTFEALRLTLTYLKQLGKRTKSIVCYVEHPKTPIPNKDGSIPLCSVFSVNGGVMHNNKCDGVLIMHRQRQLDEYGKAKSSENDPVLMEVAKLKFQKYLGRPDNILLKFDFKTGIYEAWEKQFKPKEAKEADSIDYETGEVFKSKAGEEFPF